MLSIHLTLAQVVTLLNTIVQRDPERVGTGSNGAGCVYGYQNEGALTPICIVGQMFADLGLLRLLMNNPNELDFPSAMSSTCGTSSGFWEVLNKYGITADEDAARFMFAVQRRQDEGQTWGMAYDQSVRDYRDAQQDDLNARLNSLFG